MHRNMSANRETASRRSLRNPIRRDAKSPMRSAKDLKRHPEVSVEMIAPYHLK